MNKTIDDICRDQTFPLRVQSVEEFYAEYMESFWAYPYISGNDENKHFMQDAYEFLFRKWKIFSD